jgi:hypothetical protein
MEIIMFKKILALSLVLIPSFASANVLEMTCFKSQVREGTEQSYVVSADTRRKLMIVTIDNAIVPMRIVDVNVSNTFIEVRAITKYGNNVDATFLNPNNDDADDQNYQSLQSYNIREHVTTTDSCR